MTKNFSDVFYEVPDGLTLYARDYLGPSADAPVVLCLHGLSRNSRDFADLAPLLQKNASRSRARTARARKLRLGSRA